MSTDLERQLPRFAGAFDREAPAISVDEILSRGIVAVDVDRLEGPAWDLVPRVAVSRGEAMPSRGEDGEHLALIELVPTAAATRTRRGVGLKIALLAAAAAVLVVALAAIVRVDDEPNPADVPTSNVPTTAPTTTPPTPAATSGGMWPQATLEEVRAAQQLADADDPAYAWQVDPQLAEGELWIEERRQVELVDRFLREVLGWEAYLLNTAEGSRDGVYDVYYDVRYVRCAPGRTNPVYPPGPEPELGELCAPTLDDLRYESVSLDVAQLDRQGRDGIWVVNRWEMTAPFAQTDPAALEVQATERLEEFLAARIAGEGAEGHVQVSADIGVPLMYGTTSGAPYERYEIERVGRPHWPDGNMTFAVRLFADGDATVVEQQVMWDRDQSGGSWLDAHSTTENGQPVVLSYTSSDGEVSVSAPSTWDTWMPGKGGGTGGHEQAPDVWLGGYGFTRTSSAAGSASDSSTLSPTTHGARRTAGHRCSRSPPMRPRSRSRSSLIATSTRRRRWLRTSVASRPCRSTSPLLPEAAPAGSA
jgi:hypothetical protein